MEPLIEISTATASDAGIISRIAERSIRVGCAAEHRNDPTVVAAWVRNNTLAHIRPWLVDPRLRLTVARLQGRPAGVAMASASGRIAFCYVQPESFRRGVGQALVRDIEAWLRGRGVARVRLNSTRSSQAFYRHLGFEQSADAFAIGGVKAIAMHKPLIAPQEKVLPASKSPRG
ncbi:GNAT family N-acetyltransferase [Pseudomonas fluorescens]|uniref:GNAT family N-acetyltransferase n=1 Tax=Pseudomonas fluorescens TaxID=294 RepID=A0A944E3I7_PSEFL|nr:GNAT family N-acetyltransferase [Pseudomonas fluorescens]MBT2294443.1 GNAT family N-acetyltransferase [Pseudomonas fluorescens]MBT2306901.1 GNAT family N-acetyltransferase [Pseudomonas fluorescens]MBT2316189.1 GNAT family N-acetyltransferase [Pseudomonas fluorescens]MBT2331731.1 GNAT family N-acetyltransferase [Pseudomonas fluorescens]MBT2342575.1 GNAT family N-acetyltransferase [Pseudomonas fluorescens]